MSTELAQIVVAETQPAMASPATRTALKIDSEPPQATIPTRQRALRLVSSGYAFFVAGVSDGSIGTMIPYVIQAYGVNTTIVSSIYGAAFFGWLLSAVSNAHLSHHLDVGALLVLGSAVQVIGSAPRAWAPPFGLYAVTFFIISLGQGYQDTHVNTYVAEAKTAHRWLGFIHAMYAAGCLVGPFVANAVASSRMPSPWNLFYTVPVGLGVLNLVLVGVAFRDTIALRRDSRTEPDSTQHRDPSSVMGATELMKGTLVLRSVWLLGLFYFFYLGAAMTAGGWVIQYLIDVRGGDLAQVGYVPAGFWGGTFIGRIVFPEFIHRFGNRRMIFLLCMLCLGLQLCFWLIPNIIVASVAVALFGMFSGPLFSTGMSLGKKLFPPELHPTALSLIFVVAQSGGSLFPIITGVVASRAGVAVLQPILVGLIVATAVSWLLVPKPKSAGNASLHED